MSVPMSVCQFVQRITGKLLMHWVRQYRANSNVFSSRQKAASVEFGLRTGSGRLFQADGPAMVKARRPYVLSR